jgi:hypothetical protein
MAFGTLERVAEPLDLPSPTRTPATVPSRRRTHKPRNSGITVDNLASSQTGLTACFRRPNFSGRCRNCIQHRWNDESDAVTTTWFLVPTAPHHHPRIRRAGRSTPQRPSPRHETLVSVLVSVRFGCECDIVQTDAVRESSNLAPILGLCRLASGCDDLQFRKKD